MTFARKMIKFAGLVLMAVLLLGMCTQAFAVEDPVEFAMEIDPQSLTAPGEVQVSLRVSNTGETDMKDPVTLYDPAGNAVTSFGDGGRALLSAGTSVSWQGTWNVTEEQLNAGEISYKLEYHLEDEKGELVAISNTAGAKVAFIGEKADLTVTRTVSPEVVRSGKQVTVTYELYNSGNVALSSVRVKEDIARKAVTVDKLQPGEKKTVTFTSNIGNADLISKAAISYKAGDDDKSTDMEIGEQIIPLAAPNLKISVHSPDKGVNIGDKAKLQVTFTNNGNVSYSNVSVKDVNKGEIFTNISIPAGAVVTEEKEFELTEKTTFKVTATLPDNTGETQTMTSNELVIGVFDPQKQLNLDLRLEANKDSVEKTPADLRFTLTVTNKSNVAAEDVVISHGDTYITTIESLAAYDTAKIVRDVTISQAGAFCFTAKATDTMNNEVEFKSNEYRIRIAKETGSAATAEATPVPMPTAPVEPKMEDVPQAKPDQLMGNLQKVLSLVFFALAFVFAILFILFLVVTVLRMKNKSKSKAAFDHLELSERRDYTEPADEETENHPEPQELTPVRPLQDETLMAADRGNSQLLGGSQEMNQDGSYRISRSPADVQNQQPVLSENRQAVQTVTTSVEEE